MPNPPDHLILLPCLHSNHAVSDGYLSKCEEIPSRKRAALVFVVINSQCRVQLVKRDDVLLNEAAASPNHEGRNRGISTPNLHIFLPLIFLSINIDHIQLKIKGQSSLLKYRPNRITFQGELRIVVKQKRENVLHTLQDYTYLNYQWLIQSFYLTICSYQVFLNLEILVYDFVGSQLLHRWWYSKIIRLHSSQTYFWE